MSGRILLIEDDPVSQEVSRALCESRGFSVDVASDGFEGLKLMRDTAYEVALVDYHLPAMDGYALARLIREGAKPGAKPPKLVGVTADRGGLAARQDASSLFDVLLSKPLTPDALFNVVDATQVAAAGGPGPFGALLREPSVDRARAATEAFWRRRGLGTWPKALVYPTPTDEEAEAIRHCFDICEDSEAADLLLLLGPAARGGLQRLRQDGPGFLLPAVDLSEELGDVAAARFRVHDPDAWADVAAAVLRCRERSRDLGPAMRAGNSAQDRLLALLYVTAPESGAGDRRLAPLAKSGFPQALASTALSQLIASGLVQPRDDGEHLLTESGFTALTRGEIATNQAAHGTGPTSLPVPAPVVAAGEPATPQLPTTVTGDGAAHLDTLRKLFLENLATTLASAGDGSGGATPVTLDPGMLKALIGALPAFQTAQPGTAKPEGTMPVVNPAARI